MKFDQLIEYNMKKYFLKNHTQNAVEKLFPDSFSKKSELIISILYSFVFIVCQFESYRNILKLSCRPLAFT